MVELAESLPEVRLQRARAEFVDLGELPAKGVLTHDKPDQASRFRVYPASEFGDGPPLEWIVRGILPRAELAVIFGESGSGKSFFALDLCAAITRGIEWREKRTAHGGVVYVCAEGSGGFKARLKAYAHANAVELSELPAVIPDAPNLLEPKEAAALTQAVVEWVDQSGSKVDVIIIDTLSATAPGGNENSGEDMGRVLSHCKFLSRKTGALVVLIHHSGKDATKGARGWSGLRAAADAEIEITRNGDYRAATVTKMKDGMDGGVFNFKLKIVPLGLNTDGEEESSCVIEHTDEAPEAARTGRQKPSGALQVTMLDVLKTMAPAGTVNRADLTEGFWKKLGGRGEHRVRDATRAIDGLIAKKLAYSHDGDRVSLTSLVTSGDEKDWLA